MRTARIEVALTSEGDRSYEVLVRDGILGELVERLPRLEEASSLFIVTDSTVSRLYGMRLKAELAEVFRRVELVSFPPGEANKNIETAWALAARLNRLGADRESSVLALGGGVVGDLAGFVASIYKRGIEYYQLPTTLLSQVDSSIGGKTGVDAPWGKNQIGTFHQPRGVLTDPLVLRTLPRREIMNGIAEIVKCAVVADRRMFDRLSTLAGTETRVPNEIIVDACRIKAAVVSKDETEAGLRAVLNYGHTVGHAIEGASDYRVGHGACVILGMIAEGWIALRLGILRRDDFERQSELLLRLSTGVEVGEANLDKNKLLRFALADKKSSPSGIKMSLPAELGRMHTARDGSHRSPVSSETFKESIDYLAGVLSSASAPSAI
ncbi:MAG: 3-dehydroquinate synthase [Nitrososphaerota archaeon]|nr:3-dehydroquinate synthase [Nitrososphaerota archaeon]